MDTKTLDFILLEIAQDYEQQVQDFLSLDTIGICDDCKEKKPLFYQKLCKKCYQKRVKKYQEKYDLITDAEPIASNIPTGTTRLQKRMQELRTYGKVGPTIPLSFQLVNSETGAIVRGKVLQNFEKNTIQMTPVSSSNVKSVGALNNELLVQFHPSKKIPQRTYRYQFESPEMAQEAYRSLANSGSPGRWVWQNIRGHTKGEPTGIQNVPFKYGPSLSPPGQGKEVIGGTSASLVKYNISNRTPVSRAKGFDKMSRQLKRITSNPIKEPNIGSRVEGVMAGRRLARNLGSAQLKTISQISQLPKLDFIVRDIESTYYCHLCETNHYYNSEIGKKHLKESIIKKTKILKKVRQLRKIDFTIRDAINYDFLPMNSFKKITFDSAYPFTVFRGPIARDGGYDYKKNGKWITLYKKFDNLKDIYSRYDYLPLRVSDEIGAHFAEEIGYGTNFTPNEETHEIEADLILVDQRYNHIIDHFKDYHVSPGYNDIIKNGDIQIITDLDHIAMSLGKEKGRACTGMNAKGKSCTKVKPWIEVTNN